MVFILQFQPLVASLLMIYFYHWCSPFRCWICFERHFGTLCFLLLMSISFVLWLASVRSWILASRDLVAKLGHSHWVLGAMDRFLALRIPLADRWIDSEPHTFDMGWCHCQESLHLGRATWSHYRSYLRLSWSWKTTGVDQLFMRAHKGCFVHWSPCLQVQDQIHFA